MGKSKKIYTDVKVGGKIDGEEITINEIPLVKKDGTIEAPGVGIVGTGDTSGITTTFRLQPQTGELVYQKTGEREVTVGKVVNTTYTDLLALIDADGLEVGLQYSFPHLHTNLTHAGYAGEDLFSDVYSASTANTITVFADGPNSLNLTGKAFCEKDFEIDYNPYDVCLTSRVNRVASGVTFNTDEIQLDFDCTYGGDYFDFELIYDGGTKRISIVRDIPLKPTALESGIVSMGLVTDDIVINSGTTFTNQQLVNGFKLDLDNNKIIIDISGFAFGGVTSLELVMYKCIQPIEGRITRMKDVINNIELPFNWFDSMFCRYNTNKSGLVLPLPNQTLIDGTVSDTTCVLYPVLPINNNINKIKMFDIVNLVVHNRNMSDIETKEIPVLTLGKGDEVDITPLGPAKLFGRKGRKCKKCRDSQNYATTHGELEDIDCTDKCPRVVPSWAHGGSGGDSGISIFGINDVTIKAFFNGAVHIDEIVNSDMVVDLDIGQLNGGNSEKINLYNRSGLGDNVFGGVYNTNLITKSARDNVFNELKDCTVYSKEITEVNSVTLKDVTLDVDVINSINQEKVFSGDDLKEFVGKGNISSFIGGTGDTSGSTVSQKTSRHEYKPAVADYTKSEHFVPTNDGSGGGNVTGSIQRSEEMVFDLGTGHTSGDTQYRYIAQSGHIRSKGKAIKKEYSNGDTSLTIGLVERAREVVIDLGTGHTSGDTQYRYIGQSGHIPYIGKAIKKEYSNGDTSQAIGLVERAMAVIYELGTGHTSGSTATYKKRVETLGPKGIVNIDIYSSTSDLLLPIITKAEEQKLLVGTGDTSGSTVVAIASTIEKTEIQEGQMKVYTDRVETTRMAILGSSMPTGVDDVSGIDGEIRIDANYQYIKTINGWARQVLNFNW